MLVAAFWREHRLALGQRADRLQVERESWAADAVGDVIAGAPADAVALLEDLLLADDADVAFLGAGPLEDLLVEHGAAVANTVAARCTESAVWREAVSCVWLDDKDRAAVSALEAWLPRR